MTGGVFPNILRKCATISPKFKGLSHPDVKSKKQLITIVVWRAMITGRERDSEQGLRCSMITWMRTTPTRHLMDLIPDHPLMETVPMMTHLMMIP